MAGALFFTHPCVVNDPDRVFDHPGHRWSYLDLVDMRSRDAHTLKSRDSVKHGTDRLPGLAFQAFRRTSVTACQSQS